MDNPVKAFHFINGDKLRDGSPAAPVGGVETYNGPLVICESGLHASREPLDALTYAPGATLRLVECSGIGVEQTDKLVCTTRRVLWSADVTNLLHEFACRCAEDALAVDENPDPRSVAAIQAKRDWLAGTIDNAALTAAWAAARDAAWDAARDAAWTAARDAARAAARAAARDAARAAQNQRLADMLREAGCPQW